MVVFARILESRPHLIPGRYQVSELHFEVPGDHNYPDRGNITLFGRAVTRYELPSAAIVREDPRKFPRKPWMVYLQGGPGFGSPVPQDFALTNTVLDRGYQMLYLDSRGTGMSSPVTASTLAMLGDEYRQADYLKLFRADSIVKDLEAVRKTLTADFPSHLKRWSIVGHDFGGFCVLTYLSFYPEGLLEAFTLGGLPPISRTPDQVYAATYKKVMDRNRVYYMKYPEDIEAIQNLCFHIKSKSGLPLPSGGVLTVRGLLTLGRHFGIYGGLDFVHDLILRAKSDLARFQFITRPTLTALERAVSIDDNVIYAILQEATYCQRVASNWSADRVGCSLKEYQWLKGSPKSASVIREGPLFFSGEMIYPFLFETFPELEKLAIVADLIAKFPDWPNLYNEWQLAQNTVALYAATYVDDMYVDYELAQGTVKLVNNCRQLITNTLFPNALYSQPGEVLKLLFELRDDSID